MSLRRTSEEVIPKTVIDIRLDYQGQIQVVSDLEIEEVISIFDRAINSNAKKVSIPTIGNTMHLMVSKIVFYVPTVITDEMLERMKEAEAMKNSKITQAKMGILGPDGVMQPPPKPRLQ